MHANGNEERVESNTRREGGREGGREQHWEGGSNTGREGGREGATLGGREQHWEGGRELIALPGSIAAAN